MKVKEKIYELREQGKTVREIADQVSMAPSTVQTYTKWYDEMQREKAEKEWKSKKYKYRLFDEGTHLGDKFTTLWNKQVKQHGAQIAMAEKFNISISTVQRIIKRLGLKSIRDPNHPGRKNFVKKIKKLYLKGYSTTQIARVVRWADGGQGIGIILKNAGVEMNPQHVTNPKFFRTRCLDYTPYQLLKKIKDMYVYDKMTAAEIARKLKIDQGTVSTKLKAMNITIVIRRRVKEGIYVAPNYNIIGIYKGYAEPMRVICHSGSRSQIGVRKTPKRPGHPFMCRWCNTSFDRYITTGPRQQIYCCSSHKNKAKDLRRMMRGKRVSKERIKQFKDELKEAWGDKFNIAYARIMDVTPCVTKKTGRGGKKKWNKN